MITPPNEYFLTEEVRRHGAEPRFVFTISPHYFLTGVGAGGTHSDTSFVSPDRIQVDEDATSASWTSDVQEATVGDYPAAFTPDWTLAYPGYDVVVEFRSGATQGECESASWSTIIDGTEYDLYQYYQWRITWTGFRCWVFDTEPEMDGTAMWVVDSAPDDYLSYAADSTGSESYIEAVTFEGEYPLSQADISEAGALAFESPLDFSELVSGDHTLLLLNRDQLYSPGHANFIFSGESNWYRKFLKIEFGYKRPGTKDVVDKIVLYEGVIARWGPVVREIDASGKLQPHTVEIYSRDYIATLLEKKIGTPDDDGDPKPLVYGEVLLQADELGDKTIVGPDAEADFEDGTLNELSDVIENGSGALTVETTDPYAGSYCLLSHIEAPLDYAQGEIDLTGPGASILFSCWIQFSQVPDVPSDGNIYFAGIKDSLGNNCLSLWIADDYRVFARRQVTTQDTSWYVDQDLGIWKRLSVAVHNDPTSGGIAKVWLDGDEVLTWEEGWDGYTFAGAFVGFYDNNGVPAPETWEAYFDSLAVYNTWYPKLYQISGSPFTELKTVYIDGAVKVENTPQGVRSRLVKGTTVSSTDVTLDAVTGSVIFTDLTQDISGSVMVRAVKNTTVHPVDIIQDLLTEAGASDFIDSASFAAAKAADSGDSIGAYFEETTVGDAIKEIASRCLLNVYMDQGVIKLGAYQATAPTGPVGTFGTFRFGEAVFGAGLLIGSELELTAASETINMESFFTRITTRWGWYERNHRLRYVAEDSQAIAYLGEFESEIDFSQGQPVVSENSNMAKTKADRLLKRFKAGYSELNLSGSFRLARLELGDVICLNIDYLRPATNYLITGKTVRMNRPYGVDLTLVKFLGE